MNTRGNDFTDGTNQGIVDGRPEGRQPSPASATLSTYTDPDASGPITAPTASSTLTGATSADVHDSLGHPGKGQISQELHHDGKPGRKRQEQGLDQWGPPANGRKR